MKVERGEVGFCSYIITIEMQEEYDVLYAVIDAPMGNTQSEIAEEAGIPKKVVYRVLADLAHKLNQGGKG